MNKQHSIMYKVSQNYFCLSSLATLSKAIEILPTGRHIKPLCSMEPNFQLHRLPFQFSTSPPALEMREVVPDKPVSYLGHYRDH